MRQSCVLVVDDDTSVRHSLSKLLSAASWDVDLALSGEQALSKLQHKKFDVVLSDVRMPGMSGVDLLEKLNNDAQPPVVLISAHGDIQLAVETMEKGAYSFLEKPYDPRRLLRILHNASEAYKLKNQAKWLRDRLHDLCGLDRILLGESEAVQRLRVQVSAIQDNDSPTLICGNSGTGKDLIARALHDLSQRSAEPFVVINCAGLTTENFDLVCFGEVGSHMGQLHQVRSGTLFLDEVSALSPDIQARLLRLTETGEFFVPGEEQPSKMNARIISSTNQNIEEDVQNGNFRLDLFYRINTITLQVPSLIERREDILPLFEHFLDHYAKLYETELFPLNEAEVALLLSHHWPGNVRELRHVAERSILSWSRGTRDLTQAMFIGGDKEPASSFHLRTTVALLERELITSALRECKGRMEAAAELLGIGRRTLNEKIIKLGIDKTKM